MSSTDDPRQRALDVMLQEHLGGATPPDLSEVILRRAARPPADSSLQRWTDEHQDRDSMEHDPSSSRPSFAAFADTAEQQGFLREFCAFMRDNSKWWLLPFLFVFSLFGLAVVLGTTGAAPFIYTLF